MRSKAAVLTAASIALGAAGLALAPQAGAAPRALHPMCTTAQLSGALGASDAGAGQIYRDVVLTNHSSGTCVLDGFPGVSVLDAHGTQIGAAAAREQRSFAPVVLTPGGTATTTIHTGNRMTNNPGECRPASASLRVFPPGSRASLVIPAKLTICDIFTVTPLVGASAQPSSSPSSEPSTQPSSQPSASPSAAPTSQVSAMPSGAPNTGVAPTSSGGWNAGVLAAGAGALLVVGATGVALARGRRSRARS